MLGSRGCSIFIESRRIFSLSLELMKNSLFFLYYVYYVV
jgi:hypothetical protein